MGTNQRRPTSQASSLVARAQLLCLSKVTMARHRHPKRGTRVQARDSIRARDQTRPKRPLCPSARSALFAAFLVCVSPSFSCPAHAVGFAHRGRKRNQLKCMPPSYPASLATDRACIRSSSRTRRRRPSCLCRSRSTLGTPSSASSWAPAATPRRSWRGRPAPRSSFGVCVCVRACVCVRVCVCVSACVGSLS